eukprot:3171075-Alexandrium_andersonii.AAC.1
MLRGLARGHCASTERFRTRLQGRRRPGGNRARRSEDHRIGLGVLARRQGRRRGRAAPAQAQGLP